jgi:hypothetical protein
VTVIGPREAGLIQQGVTQLSALRLAREIDETWVTIDRLSASVDAMEARHGRSPSTTLRLVTGEPT